MSIPSQYPNDSLLAFEIAQQPDLWPTTLTRATPQSLPGDSTAWPVLLCGAGTSAYAASAVAEAWPGTMAIPTTDLLLQSTAELELTMPSLRRGGLCISLARSGDSPESTGVVDKLKLCFPSVQHLAIVCNAEGKLAKTAGVEVLLLDPRTNDRSLAMTGSFSNLTLAGLALKHRAQLLEPLPGICHRVQQAWSRYEEQISEIARHCGDRIVLLSSCMQALTKEASLKILELTAGRVLAINETFLGLRHGAVGFLREDTPVVCFLSSDPQKRRYEHDLIDDLRTKGLGRIVVVGQDATMGAAGDSFLPSIAPELPDHLRTPFEIVHAQLLAYHLALSVGVDPDNPSPEGTITRVVRPFRVHADEGAAS